MKKYEKYISVTGYMLAALLMLSGCGKGEENTNIKQGMTQIESLDYSSALESFEAAVLYEEDSELLYRGEGLAHMGLGNYEEAVNSFLTSISYAGSSVTNLQFDTNYYLAASYYKLADYKEASKIYAAIIGLRPKETDAWFLRGCASLKMNDYEAAIADFEKAFSLEPDNLELLTDAYVEMETAGYAEEGKAYLREFMSKEDKKLTDSEKGMLHYYLEDYENARIYLDGALNQGNAKFSLILGQTYEKLGDMNYAVVVYHAYLDTNAPDAALYNSLGGCLMKQQKYEEALKAFEAGIEIGDSAYQQNLKFNQIVANEYLGNFGTAKELMTAYITAYPDDAKALREAAFLQTR